MYMYKKCIIILRGGIYSFLEVDINCTGHRNQNMRLGNNAFFVLNFAYYSLSIISFFSNIQRSFFIFPNIVLILNYISN